MMLSLGPWLPLAVLLTLIGGDRLMVILVSTHDTFKRGAAATYTGGCGFTGERHGS